MIGVYRIIHVESQRSYVGSSGNVAKRWTQHKSLLRHMKHSSQKLQRAWSKYGEQAFILELLEECELSALRAKEQYWLETLKGYEEGFNCTRVALEHSAEVRERISKSKQGRTVSDETREKMSKSHKSNGIRPSTSQLHTPEAKAKSAAARVGLHLSEETKLKIGAGQAGKHSNPRGPMSEETKSRISKANMGKRRTLRGRKFSEETRKRMSDSAKARCAKGASNDLS